MQDSPLVHLSANDEVQKRDQQEEDGDDQPERNLWILDVFVGIVAIFVIVLGFFGVLQVQVVLEAALLVRQYLVGFVDPPVLSSPYWNSSRVFSSLFLSGW